MKSLKRIILIICILFTISLIAIIWLVSSGTLIIKNGTVIKNNQLMTGTPVLYQNNTESVNSYNKIVKQCVNTTDSKNSINEVINDGVVLLSSGLLNCPTNLLDLSTGKQIKLPYLNNNGCGGFHISPNGSYLSYVENIQDDQGQFTKENIWVVDSKGVVISSLLRDLDILSSEWRWLDNERIEFNTRQTAVDGTVGIYYPFIDEWKEVKVQLPDILTSSSYDLYHPFWIVNYSKDMDWAIYLSNNKDHGMIPILYNIAKQEIIWQGAYDPDLPILNEYGDLPKWSRSGDEIAMVDHGEIYIIKQNGKGNKTQIFDTRNKILAFSWSPDGHYVSLFTKIEGTPERRNLMLLDLQTNQVIDYCLEDNAISEDFPPIWSPNSQMFYYYSDSGTTIFVDTKQQLAYKLTEVPVPILWMSSEDTP